MTTATGQGATKTTRTAVLDPVSRASEILFGLIMVLTFTASFNASEAGRSEIRLMLIAALGCNLAWGLIDAAMYLIATRAERALSLEALRAVQTADDPDEAHARIAAALPPLVAEALDRPALEKVRLSLAAHDPDTMNTRLGPRDWIAAGLVFALVFLCTFPVVLPFILMDQARSALFVSHGIAIGSLFITGWTLGRQWGRPAHVGTAIVIVGISLVLVAIALGG